MFETVSRLEIAVLLGVVGAAVLIFVSRRLGHKRELLVYTVGLVLTAVAYLLFGLGGGAPSSHLAVEAVGALIFIAAAVLGAWRWPLLLALGWTGHVAWDLFFHHANGPGFAPAWYPLPCVGFDLFLGGYIAGLVAQQRIAPSSPVR